MNAWVVLSVPEDVWTLELEAAFEEAVDRLRQAGLNVEIVAGDFEGEIEAV
jgi:hypothetical protein